MDNQFDSIMDRIRARQSEMSGGGGNEAKENDTAVLTRKTSVKDEQTPTKVFGLSSRSNDSGPAPVQFRQPERAPSTPDGTYQDSQMTENSTTLAEKTTNQSSSSTTKKTSRFSMLAAEIENFEYDYESPYNKPKEAYMKGRSPRMSIGETRPAVLCTPAGHAAGKSPSVAANTSQSAPEVTRNNGPEIALGRSDFEARRIKFAQPIVNVNYLPNESSIFSGSGCSVNDQSTVLGGSAEMMNVTTSSLSCGELSIMNQHLTNENTIINAQSCDNREAILQGRLTENMSTDEYGAHTFMRKKVPKDVIPTSSVSSTTTSTASGGASSSGALPPSLRSASESTAPTPTSIFQRPTNLQTLVSSPKPYSKDIGRSMFSPVHFTPKSTSSPKTIQNNLPATIVPNADAVLSPSKSAALQNSVAKTRRLEFEEKLRSISKTNSTNVNVPTTVAPVPLARHIAQPPASAPPIIAHNTPHFQIPAQQKKNLFGVVPLRTSSQNKAPLVVATAPIPVQTQWRGQANTPVVQGARADEKTAGEQLVGAGVGKLKNLKSRWEFSSATGTPIHPDATEDSLIETAKKMKESAIPNRIGQHRSTSSRRGLSTTSINSQNAVSTPYDEERYIDESENEDDDVFGEHDAVQNHLQNPDDVHNVDTSRFIDHAFGFMEGPGTETPSPYRDTSLVASPLKKTLREKAEVIEEEDVQEEEEEEYTEPETEEELPEEEHDVTEIQKTLTGKPEEEDEETPVYRANNSQLVHSVSMYRRKQREKNNVTNQTLSVISPSAPIASLTSPQKLKSLTSSSAAGTPGRIFETQHDAVKRLHAAITIEKKLVQQSEHALARARHEPTFRGSREEFEAQRAYLVHMEKLRAMQNELQRVQVEGARIIDGPRGTITINALTVSIDTAYVAAHIASKKSEEVFYFLAVLRYADQVDVSKLVTSDSGLNRTASLDFPVPLRLVKIPADFRATVEIYGQRSLRESTTHEDKFKLKGTTLKAKARNPFSNGNASGNQSSIFGNLNHTVIGSGGNAPIITDFHLLGSFSFDINCPGKHVYQLSHVVHPIAGKVQMKVKKTPDDGADILFRGFLSMYQRTNEGLGSWTRYWCVLENGEMKFWRQPEDEGTKGYLVLMDLSTCCRSEGASTVQDICPFPNSFHIDVWVPKDEGPSTSEDTSLSSSRPGIMPLRVMLAADTAVDLQKWLSVINSTSRQLCTWRNPIVPQ